MKKNNKGFTLVELIVVLVILAILAAILTPALLGYIDRARSEKDYSTAQTVRVAAQAVIDEAYGANTLLAKDSIDTTTGVSKFTDMDGVISEATKDTNTDYGAKVTELAGVKNTDVTAFIFTFTDGIIDEGYVTIKSQYYHLTSTGTWEPAESVPGTFGVPTTTP